MADYNEGMLSDNDHISNQPPNLILLYHDKQVHFHPETCDFRQGALTEDKCQHFKGCKIKVGETKTPKKFSPEGALKF